MSRNTRESLNAQWPGIYAIHERETKETHAELVDKGAITQTLEEFVEEMKEGWIKDMLSR